MQIYLLVQALPVSSNLRANRDNDYIMQLRIGTERLPALQSPLQHLPGLEPLHLAGTGPTLARQAHAGLLPPLLLELPLTGLWETLLLHAGALHWRTWLQAGRLRPLQRFH